jgi:hypothetical protein
MNFSEIVVSLVLFILILFFLLKKNDKKIEKTNSFDYEKEVTFQDKQIQMPSSIGLWLPKDIEDLSKRKLREIVHKIFDSYKIFDYKKMDLNELNKKEWHSWQVSMLLMLFKKDEEYFIVNQEEIFHDFLLNSNENDIKSFIHTILRKYKKQVDISSKKDKLCKEYIWTNKEISILFYFLANYKNFKI